MWWLNSAAWNLSNITSATGEKICVLCWSHDRITEVNRNLHLVHVADEVFDSHKIIRPGGHYRKRIQIKPDHINQDLLQQSAFVIGAFLSISVIPAANPVDCHHQERTGAT